MGLRSDGDGRDLFCSNIAQMLSTEGAFLKARYRTYFINFIKYIDVAFPSRAIDHRSGS